MADSTDDLLTDDVEEQILYSARRVARQFRGIAAGDLAQEGRIWVVSHPARMRHFFTDEVPKRGWVRMVRQIEKAMSKMARTEKAAREGYNPDDEYFYGLAVLELVLPALWDIDLRRDGPSRDDGDSSRLSGKGDPAEGNTWAALVADVQSAWDHADLDQRCRTMLCMKYDQGLTYADIGRAMGVAQSTAHTHIKRSLRKLQRHLGGARPEPCGSGCEECMGQKWVGGRRAMSNAQARAVTDNAYEV